MAEPQELTFKQMCERFGVTPRTLRYYEYIELLSPRKVGRNRFYGPRELARMKLILDGRSFGFSLEEIRQWLEIYGRQGTRAQYLDFVARADRQLGALQAQIAALRQSHTQLEQRRREALDEVAAMDAAASRESG